MCFAMVHQSWMPTCGWGSVLELPQMGCSLSLWSTGYVAAYSYSNPVRNREHRSALSFRLLAFCVVVVVASCVLRCVLLLLLPVVLSHAEFCCCCCPVLPSVPLNDPQLLPRAVVVCLLLVDAIVRIFLLSCYSLSSVYFSSYFPGIGRSTESDIRTKWDRKWHPLWCALDMCNFLHRQLVENTPAYRHMAFHEVGRTRLDFPL